MPQKARTPEQARRAVAQRWTPEARTASAIRVLVEKAPPLTEAQKDQLRALLAPVASAAQDCAASEATKR